MNSFEEAFSALSQVKPENALETTNKIFELIGRCKSFKSGYKLIAFYQTLDLHDSKNSNAILISDEIKEAAKHQIHLIDNYDEIALFGDLFQPGARRFHNAKKLHCPLRLHPDALDATC